MQACARKLGVIEASYASAIIGVLSPVSSHCYFSYQDVSTLAVVVTIERLSIISVSWTALCPYRIAGAGIDREGHAFMRSSSEDGSPKPWWTLKLWERAGRFSRSRLVLGVMMLALPGCMTTGHQSTKGLDPSVRSAPPRGALNDPSTN